MKVTDLRKVNDQIRSVIHWTCQLGEVLTHRLKYYCDFEHSLLPNRGSSSTQAKQSSAGV